MDKNLDHVKINMIVAVQTAIAEQVKNSVILLMVVKLNLVFVVVVKAWDHVPKTTVIVVAKKDTAVLLMHSVLLIMDVNLTSVFVLLKEIHAQMLRKH